MNFYIFININSLSLSLLISANANAISVFTCILSHVHVCYNKIHKRYINGRTEYVINNRTVRPYFD